jgi:S-adenosylmethionine:tRNA ribosyltransferase-isomerase
MKLSDLQFNLPEGLIANTPTEPRDHARLLLLNRNTKEITHKHFFDLLDLLTPNDVLVLNNTKVFPARLLGKKETGGAIELLLLEQKDTNTWTAMHRGKLLVNQVIELNGFKATVIQKDELIVTLSFSLSGDQLRDKIWEQGLIPLPPYIHSEESEAVLREKYQTVYASLNGSVAAPTAGLHFTSELLEKLTQKGIQIEYVTLHVGMGTFLPVKEDEITKHKMHEEHFVIDTETATRLNESKKKGKRIVSVGTTTTRVLESVADESGQLDMNNLAGNTSIFIYPPYKYRFIDALITNFHLPHSTLLALVSAFVTKPNTSYEFTNFLNSPIGEAYEDAIKSSYHFYSFGDACFIF